MEYRHITGLIEQISEQRVCTQTTQDRAPQQTVALILRPET